MNLLRRVQDYAGASFRFLTRRKTNYQLCFGSPAGQEVLRDLAKFCRATKSTAHPNAKLQDTLEGRRQVWLRIAEHIHLTPQQLYDLYEPPQILEGPEQ